jgi:hypothetical protein
MAIPWVYVWNDKHAIFHHILQDTMNETELKLEPVYIGSDSSKVEIRFEEKAKAIIGALKSALEQNISHIIFSDVDVILGTGIYERVKPFIENGSDMVLSNELGMAILRVCPEVLDFWINVRPSSLEHLAKNTSIKSNLKISKFDSQLFTTTNTWTRDAPYAILQTSSSELGKELDLAEKIFTVAQYINADSYMKYVDEETIPFIYQIQEILIRSHQQAKRASQN